VGKVVASRFGFGNDTVNVTLDPGRDTTITLRVRADSTSPISGGTVSKAASIILLTVSEQNIAIRGSGLNETSFLTFEARDSSGNPLGTTNRVVVNFSIQGGPGGGEYVFPVSQETDPTTGKATTRVTSGTRAGILQVYATTVVNGVTLRSSPVRLTVSGGLPVQQRFSISREKSNIAGGVLDGLRAKINVLVGDREGNPVVPNTAIYFTTTGGLIQPSALTDKDGAASVELISGNPRPAGGIAVITARTVGDSGVVVSQSIPVVFSGKPLIVGPTAPFVILDNGSYSFAYSVRDANGNPLSQGTTIRVTASGPGSGDLALSGDSEATLPDTDDPSFTNFAVTVTDQQAAGASGPVTITISVAGDNGTATYSFSGEVRVGQAILEPPISARQPASIAFIEPPTATDIFVANTGNTPEFSVLTYEVRDSLGSPIDKARRTAASYNLQFYPNTFASGGTGPTLIGTDSTDDSGRLRVQVNSGTRSGVVQVVVNVSTVSGTVRSSPVRISINSGFADQRHFSVFAPRYNFPGLQAFNTRLSVTAQVVDRYSNPVKPGTAVYFSTLHGSVQTISAFTAIDGFVTKDLISGNPTPEGIDVIGLGPGFSYVYAQTLGENGTTIIDSILVLWTGRPIISVLTSVDPFAVPDGSSVGPFVFSVEDIYGHPMSAGTSISVGGTGVNVDGDANISMFDTFSSGPGTTVFTVSISDASPLDTDPPAGSVLTITVTHPVYGTFKRILATGTVD
ncbi:MAG TPA: Ig-like domain-containing protein, partial [Bacteroidota bacterium]